jgi:hypothetical protein
MNNSFDKQSIIFDENYNENDYFELTKILRTDDLEIFKIYEITRSFIDSTPSLSEICAEFRKYNIKRTGIKEEIIKLIKSYLLNDEDFAVLSYRNKIVDEFSQVIGKCLLETKTNKYGYFLNTKYIMKAHFNKRLTNNTEFQIQDVIYENNKYLLKIITETKHTLEITVYDKEEYDSLSESILSNLSKLKKFTTNKCDINEKRELIKYAEDVVNQDPSIKTLYKDSIEGAIIKLKQDLRILVLKGDENFNLGYSMTIHRAQGSTFDYGIINLRDIFCVNLIDLEEKARLLYVASSRFSKGIIYYI